MSDKRRELAEQISCPVAWSSVCPQEEFAQVLRYFWFKTVQKYEWYRETDLLSTEDWQPDEFFIEEIYGPIEIDSALDHINRWRARACAEYQSTFARFAKLRAASDKDRSKHYCQPNSTDAEVATLSIIRGESVLYPRIDIAYQERVSWVALLEVWFSREEAHTADLGDLVDTSVVLDAFTSVFGRHSLRVAMELGVSVGCTAGRPSTWLLFDYDFSTPIFHAYPISPEEAQSEQSRFTARI